MRHYENQNYGNRNRITDKVVIPTYDIISIKGIGSSKLRI
jgi:hypothetical protein